MDPCPPPGDATSRGIVYWFRPTTTPVGGAPEDIRRQWLDVLLPVRDPRPIEGPLPYVGTDVIDRTERKLIEDGVKVTPSDALRALRLHDRDAAASWWEALLRERPLIDGFVFRRAEGDLLPPSLARLLHPDLDEHWS